MTTQRTKTAGAHAYQYGRNTLLSRAYTAGRNGLPCLVYAREKSSAAYRAWKAGFLEDTAAILRKAGLRNE